MALRFRLAWGNLRRQPRRNLLLGSISALAAFTVILGSSFLLTAQKGMAESFQGSFTADILVGPVGDRGEKPSIFGASLTFNMGTGQGIYTIRDPELWLSRLAAWPGVGAISPQLFGIQMMVLEGDWRGLFGFLGVEPEAYQQVFPETLEFLQGGFPPPGTPGLVFSESMARKIGACLGRPLELGQKVKLQGLNNDIRLLSPPVTGIFRFRHPNPSLEDQGFLDLDSLRYLLAISSGDTDADAQAGSGFDSWDPGSPESFFQDGLFLEEAVTPEPDPDAGQPVQVSPGPMAGDWQYVLLRLEDGSMAAKVCADLNRLFEKEGVNLLALEGLEAGGTQALMVQSAMAVFLVLCGLLGLVLVVVLGNIQWAGLAERRVELATIRALGGRKSTLWAILLDETLLLHGLAALGGLGSGLLILAILGTTGVPAPQGVLAQLFGSQTVHPSIELPSCLWTWLGVLILGLISSLYPIHAVLRLHPAGVMAEEN